MILLLVRSAGRREAGYYLRQLVGEPKVATERELAALATGGTRFAARRFAFARGGRRLASYVRRLQRAQARLALDLSRDLTAKATEHRAEALAMRQWLEAHGHPEAYAPGGSGSASGWLWVAGCVAAAAVAVLLAAAIRALGGG